MRGGGGGEGHRSYGPDQRAGLHRRRVNGFGQLIAVADHQQIVGTFQGVPSVRHNSHKRRAHFLA